MEGLQPTGGASNYFLGSDRKQWHTGIPHYAQLSAPRVYDGIDLVFYSNGGDLEYDFVVAPDADPKQIRLAFDGVDRMRVDGQSGDLLLTTTGGSELRHLRPKVYQQVGDERVEVASSYQILDRRHATFMLASYDRRRTLVIDPAVGFTAFLAGKKSDVASALAVDSSGNAYVTGSTYSIDFPRTGPPPTTQNPLDAFVTKLSPTGAIVFSNYLGGSDSDQGFGIAVDSTGVFATGITVSTDFPTQAPIFPQRGIDAYVTKFSPDGNVLVYSTYLGGSGQEHGNGIAVDSAHAAWVVGTTDSSDFPIFGGPNAGQQRTHGGGFDAFLAKIAPSGMSVAFSTYAGGQGDDKGYSVAVDSTGSVYATGSGASKFPITTGMRPCGTSGGAFAMRLKGIGTQTRYATCLPHAEGAGIAVDANFNAYLTGIAYDDFPTTPGAYQRTKPTPRNSGLFTAFVAKLTSSGGVGYSTYLGGTSGITFARGIAATKGGIAYVGGGTSSTDFPGLGDLKVNPTGGFLLKLAPQGNARHLHHASWRRD